MWGCSGDETIGIIQTCIFPTHVGMFRLSPRNTLTRKNFPHACGDVPAVITALSAIFGFSPRMWGCSDFDHGTIHSRLIFPTHVGMFRSDHGTTHSRLNFPHACGDVPMEKKKAVFKKSIFPTHVGMFRSMLCPFVRIIYFPHACGDVPSCIFQEKHHMEFSPRMWGCSVVNGRRQSRRLIFPTHVGMFRKNEKGGKGGKDFPHACGDVPPSAHQPRR